MKSLLSGKTFKFDLDRKLNLLSQPQSDLYGADWTYFKSKRLETLATTGSPFPLCPLVPDREHAWRGRTAMTEFSYVLLQLLKEFSAITSENAKGSRKQKVFRFVTNTVIKFEVVISWNI